MSSRRIVPSSLLQSQFSWPSVRQRWQQRVESREESSVFRISLAQRYPTMDGRSRILL